MGQARLKNKDADLRWLIKLFKNNSDDLPLLRHYYSALLRAIRLGDSAENKAWRGEGLHQLALFHFREGEYGKAESFYMDALAEFGENEPLGLSRTLRDYALLYVTCGESDIALYYAKIALSLHNEDLVVHDEAGDADGVAKAKRQEKLTRCYIWYIQLAGPLSDTEVLERLVDFALNECTDCCPRDQEQVVAFAMAHAPTSYRQRLRLHLGMLYAVRFKPVPFTGNLIRFGLDMPRFSVGYAYRFLFRRE